MALCRLVYPRILSRICPSIFHLQKNFNESTTSKNCSTDSTIDLDDAIDNFTIALLQKKKEGWDMRNEKLKSCTVLEKKYVQPKVVVENLSVQQLDEVFNCAIVECNDAAVLSLLRECFRLRICPSNDFIVQILNICSQNGELDLIGNLEQLCTDKHIRLPSNFNFDIYKAHAIWTEGQVKKGLDMFHKIYNTNPFVRRNIRVILKQLISNEVKNNSEAILIYMLKISKEIIYCHKDYFFMICIWESCFVSDLYSDQELALELLYTNRKLIETLTSRIPFLVSCALRKHKTDLVHRLLECFHVMEMKEQCTIVAMAFLDYHFLQKNVTDYLETVRWCNQSDIALPSIYSDKFFNLLLKKRTSITNNEDKIKLYSKNKKPLDFLF